MQTPLATALPNPPASPHIQVMPGVCGGRPCIAGTRIRVQDVVVWHERLSWSADEICSRHPQVTLADVYAALAYYHDHRAQLDRQMEEGRKHVEELRAKIPSKLPSNLPTTE
jgi:uncharacterized protein (DUF433 family)